ncbi:FecR domain-containing protein, partial [Bradyrhizobium sp. WYCCWR 13022]|uniref:FecR domain-containing protein n=1 Tax=unclassified Bradyrhizobium TaxID=2631580 RepID=UPI00263B6201
MFPVGEDSGDEWGAALQPGGAPGVVDMANPARIVVPDASLLFSGEFKRAGVDLELSRDDRHFLIRDYFRGEHRAGLASPDGAWLTGDVVTALTGHTQYAQADGSTSAGKIIGHVTKLVGNATAIRNGVSIVLNLGDNLEKGDVVQSGSDSKLGITFIDGTVFGLASNSRMVLNEMVYDPNGSNNSSLLSLVAGTITFVAGQTAKHGDMKVDTPVATMGIRGTAVLVQKIEFLVSNVSPNGGQGQVTAGFQVLVEPDGTTGSYILMDRTTLAPIATVDDAGKLITYNQGVFSTAAAAPLSAEIQQLISDVFALKFTDANPKALNQFTDSIVPDGIPHILFAGDDGYSSKYSVSFQLGPVTATATFEFVPVYLNFPPTVNVTSGEFTVRSAAANRANVDSVSGIITFEDVNRGDVPTVKTNFVSFKVLDAQGRDITATLTAKELAAITAVEVDLAVVPAPGNNSSGSVSWTYSVADRAFDFLRSGRTLVLTYNAQVDTNNIGYNTTVQKPFTITISSPPSVEWIPNEGFWSVGSNWSSGLVPTALYDVFIPAEVIVGGADQNTVTIVEAAFANSVTLGVAGTSGGAQLINNSTLTTGNALTLYGESTFYNFGTTIVGLLELLDRSALHNSGRTVLMDGGDFIDQSSVSNDEGGMLELAGGTLNVAVNVANSGLVLIDPGADLSLYGASFNGSIENKGTIDLTGRATLINGSLDNFGRINVSGTGNAFHDEIVSNFGAIAVTGQLTFDFGTTITGGTIFNAGIVKIESGQGATLNSVDVENLGGVIQVGSTSDDGVTLTLNGTLILGGVVNDNGVIHVTGNSAINNAAIYGGQIFVDDGYTLTLNGTTVTDTVIHDAGVIQVDVNQTRMLDHVAIDGGTINNLGLLEIIGDSSISDNTLNNNVLTVDDGKTLTLSGVRISGGTINDGNVLGAGVIVIASSSKISDADIDGGLVTIDAATQLTLDNVTVT